MRVEQFDRLVTDLLVTDDHAVPGADHLAEEIKVVGTDGVTLYLRIVRGAGPNDGQSADEVVVTKTAPGVQRLEG